MKPDIGLQEIANWQLSPAAPTTFHVNLPKLQRGFVWDPVRIINLWDSILRGFPIGSLLLSEIGEDSSENRSNDYWLLDGQQRATSIAMGFYNPWEGHADLADATEKQGWSLKVIPVLWIDILPKKSADQEKLFFPYLVTQSHPWGYNRSGAVLSWKARRDALQVFASAADDAPYTSLALKDVFPWEAKLPVPMAFLIECARKCFGNDQTYKESLIGQCRHLPEAWRSQFEGRLAELSATHFAGLREASTALMRYRVHLNRLSLRTRGNDSVNSDDDSILFVRLNTGGKVLSGEELIFSLFKSAFPTAKDAVENAAAGFIPPSRLFSLFVRLVAADGDPSKLHTPVSLRDFKARIADSGFKNRLKKFIDDRVADIMERARDMLRADPDRADPYRLPAALATRTINEAPDVFLALLSWLDRDGSVRPGSEEHRHLLASITALSWFGGNARQQQENLRQWMQVAHRRPFEEFWKPDTLRTLFTRLENPVPSFPQPVPLADFLEKAIVNNTNYRWETLGAICPDHEIFSCYAHIPSPDEVPSEAEPGATKQLLRDKRVQQNLRSFLGTLRWNKNLLLFAQRGFIAQEFREFQQWDVVLEDTNSPWDWDHIYPSAHAKRSVDPRYREWHNTIGNKRAEELSHNRGNGSTLPKDKLDDPKTRKDGFISEELWEMIQALPTDIKNPAPANALCRIILKRMALIYGEWYATLGIGELMAVEVSPQHPAAPVHSAR